jgi:hypothetical protein
VNNVQMEADFGRVKDNILLGSREWWNAARHGPLLKQTHVRHSIMRPPESLGRAFHSYAVYQ